uniref:Uncharacterized protein n=1 Tax=Melanopsichium pennsylvanicum 4 TaxID=1398559 RepID=A0A077R2A3_9BASI|nr:uncharacterized protein BN887_00375 [Melanopsichium pennsylvanicum 4]
MNTSFSESCTASETILDRSRIILTDLNSTKRELHQRQRTRPQSPYPQHFTTSQQQHQHQHQQHNLPVHYSSSMYQASSHAKPYGQQHQSNQHHPPQQQRESTIDGFSNVPRSISTPVWISTGSNPASSLHLHSSTMCNNVGVGNSTGVMGGGRGGTHAVPNASCSSSSSGSVLSFWDQRVPSDSDLTMTTALTWSDSQSNALPEIDSQYLSYLPPAQNYSRFYANPNPFEIKHRRRTTKTQFCVLESTFRDIPKPNATLRKQISVQLNMPIE